MKSFADPDTYFHIVISHTPVTVDGVPKGAPTGHVMCELCHEVAKRPEDIPHTETPDGRECPQKRVTSRFEFEKMKTD